jgi:ornithine cyclodeaminase
MKREGGQSEMSPESSEQIAYLGAAALRRALPYARLIDALRKGLSEGIACPPRGSFRVSGGGNQLLTMPAWVDGGPIGVKLVTIFPGNSARSLPGVHSSYVLFDAEDGRPVAMIDGTELTFRRTAAISALATRLLAGPAVAAGAGRLALLGSGGLAPHVAQAHVEMGLARDVVVWARRSDAAERTVAALDAMGVRASVSPSAEAAVRDADVIACATSAQQPFLLSDWVADGAHVNLIGSYAPHMQEAESALIARARVFADNRHAVLEEAGDILRPIAEGVVAADCIEADLAELSQGFAYRRQPGRPTVFKSVGWGALDLIAAQEALRARPAD